MYKFWCPNLEHEDKADFYFGEEKEGVCPGCGAQLKLLGEVTHFFARFRSMSPEDKKKVMLRRSEEHSKKNGEIQARREMLDAQAGVKAKKT